MLRGLCLFLVAQESATEEGIPEAGRLADEHGDLLVDLGILRQLVFDHLSAAEHSHTAAQYLASGDALLAAHALNDAIGGSSAGLRDLGALRGLVDAAFLELVASLRHRGLHTVNRTMPTDSRDQWLAAVAADLRWLVQLLPRGDRHVLAVGHAALSWVMLSSLKADSDGFVRMESSSSLTQGWWLAQQAAGADVRRICEGGFNGGHSALAMLSSAPPEATTVSFDLL
eukprot:TRINITY_DN53873_c0_g1_i1.p1 TRINITY_DN53873_c0_g1~~TRINITY_DN53873_c0_g1_i1.p1  ORF type:complete len:228 (+),score=49.96 TRINITY_DN53873_c0_g1_i1:99-782(+)